jgi:hypothetical protein
MLACSVYVDLNPIRAGLALTPEESAYTSGCDRIRSMGEISTRMPSNDEYSSLETSQRPDAWLCELTLQEVATASSSTNAKSAASTPQESASQAGPIETAVANAIGGCPPSADCGSSAGVAAQVETKRPLPARASDQGFLPIETEHYVMLLDWTGRQLQADKLGAIPDHLAPILDRLGVNRSIWVETVHGFGRLFRQAAGRSISLVGRGARGAGSRARQRLEPPSCRRRARCRVAHSHHHDALTRRACSPYALRSRPRAVSTR